MEELGVVVDFSVASGTSRQARTQQERVLRDQTHEILATEGKTIEAGALSLLLERTGFNLWALKTQLEKLISFVGDDTHITLEQVEGMSDQFREEALYELNNAVAGRGLRKRVALSKSPIGPEPTIRFNCLPPLANEIRRLITAREFIDDHLEGGLDPKISLRQLPKKDFTSD